MTTAPSLPLARNQFRIGYTAQQEWAWLITCAFFFGSVGAGAFVVSYFADFAAGAFAGVLIVGVLKTTAHLLFLGKPLRAWRAIFAWRTSWISRGVIAMGVFCVCGFVYSLPYLGVSSLADSTLTDVFGGLAVAAAIVVMVYDGFVMKTSRGIPLWNSWLVPLLVLSYALLGGVTLALVLRAATGEGFSKTEIEAIELATLGLNLVLVGVYVLTARVRSATHQFAVGMLTRGPLGRLFLVGAVGVGLVATLVLAAVATATGSTAVLAVAAVTDLAGHFAMFFLILRAGIYAPPRPSPPPRLAPSGGTA